MIIQNKLKKLGVPETEIRELLLKIYNILISSYIDINALHRIDVKAGYDKLDDKLVLQVYLDENTIDEHDLRVSPCKR